MSALRGTSGEAGEGALWSVMTKQSYDNSTVWEDSKPPSAYEPDFHKMRENCVCQQRDA